VRVKNSRNARSISALRAKTSEVHARLVARYGRPTHPRENPLDSLIWTILSQNTNDELSERAYRRLRKAFPRWEMVLGAPEEEIASTIRVGGLANQKSKCIKDFLRWVKATYGRMSLAAICKMSVDEATEILMQHRGIGLKTVYVTLMFACGKDVFPVDTHIWRITRRLGLAPMKAGRDKVTHLMQLLVPQGEALPLHLNLIRFGRQVCQARKPRCWDCPLVDLCRYEPKNLISPA
jgi:endonuclease III